MTDDSTRDELIRLRTDLDEIRAELAQMKQEQATRQAEILAENERLRRIQPKGGLTLKVSEKGAVSVYGLGRFPVTLYKEQWERLLSHADDIRGFMAENESSLKKREGGE